eukprot:4199778-Prymnesium_polylepis.1
MSLGCGYPVMLMRSHNACFKRGKSGHAAPDFSAPTLWSRPSGGELYETERSPHTSRSLMQHAVSPAAVRTDLERLKG